MTYEERDAAKAAALSNLVNDYSFNEREVARLMAKDHPTLQQSLMRFCAAYITEMSRKSNYDERNEASVCFAKMAKNLIPGPLWNFPMI